MKSVLITVIYISAGYCYGQIVAKNLTGDFTQMLIGLFLGLFGVLILKFTYE